MSKYLLITPDNKGEMKEWPSDDQLVPFQKEVGGLVQPVYLRDPGHHLLLVNEEGIPLGLKPNPIASWFAMGFNIPDVMLGPAVLLKQVGEEWGPPSPALCHMLGKVWGWDL